MSASTASPDLVLSRYFLSQMSWEAGCIVISLSSMSFLTASRRTVLMLLASPFRGPGRARALVVLVSPSRRSAACYGDASAREHVAVPRDGWFVSGVGRACSRHAPLPSGAQPK